MKKLSKVGLTFFQINLSSVQANALSLAAQLREYDFLYVTEEEAEKLDDIETQLHDLRKQIVERRA